MEGMKKTGGQPGPFSFAIDTEVLEWAYYGNGAAGGQGWRVMVNILPE